MVGNVGNNPIAAAAQSGAAATNAGVSSSGPAKDATDSSTAPKFGQLLDQIQAKYGAKPEQQREIKKTLGKDDFLRIMITQMKNQDPTSPFKADQMAAQMAQFASVEQMQNVNATLGKMVSANKTADRLALTGMIGKTVTVDRERFPHTEGQNDSLSFVLPKEAASVKVAIVSADTGETVLEKDLGPSKAGENSFTWDGKKATTLPAKTGSYMLKVEAKDDRGQSIQTNSQGRTRVIGVSFEGSEPALLVGDNQHQEKITMQNIVRIEDAGGAQLPGAAMGSAPPAAQPGAAPHFFAFQKGVGSSNLDSSKTAPEVAAALNQFQAQQQAQPAPPKSEAQARAAAQAAGPGAVARSLAADAEKGFPNGLHDSDDEGMARNQVEAQGGPKPRGPDGR